MNHKDIREVYPMVDLGEGIIPTYVYIGFWNDLYVGFMAGAYINADTIDIQSSCLVPEFRGTKIVRIMNWMTEKIHKDFKNICVRVNNDNNDMLKILLSVGFYIIGTRTDNDVVYIELKKVNGQVV